MNIRTLLKKEFPSSASAKISPGAKDRGMKGSLLRMHLISTNRRTTCQRVRAGSIVTAKSQMTSISNLSRESTLKIRITLSGKSSMIDIRIPLLLSGWKIPIWKIAITTSGVESIGYLKSIMKSNQAAFSSLL